ncbi:uncharacterized protein ACA1_093650, partial [Acanthamoeba castellanii str. Neff]
HSTPSFTSPLSSTTSPFTPTSFPTTPSPSYLAPTLATTPVLHNTLSFVHPKLFNSTVTFFYLAIILSTTATHQPGNPQASVWTGIGAHITRIERNQNKSQWMFYYLRRFSEEQEGPQREMLYCHVTLGSVGTGKSGIRRLPEKRGGGLHDSVGQVHGGNGMY